MCDGLKDHFDLSMTSEIKCECTTGTVPHQYLRVLEEEREAPDWRPRLEERVSAAVLADAVDHGAVVAQPRLLLAHNNRRRCTFSNSLIKYSLSLDNRALDNSSFPLIVQNLVSTERNGLSQSKIVLVNRSR